MRGRIGILAAWLACGCTSTVDPVPLPDPGPLEAGVSRVRMPVPVGIGTVGYGGFAVSGDSSPFSDLYPATSAVHGHPEFKVVVLSRGEPYEIVFVRSDTVGVFQQMRRALVLELRERMGRDLDHALVFGATHTHSGPGRVIDAGGPFDLIADRFFPEFYENMVDALADAIEAAYADLQPARVGHAIGDASGAMSDRRCEDGLDYVNPDMPVIVVERGGQIDAVVTALAIHGTVLGIEEFTLSQDVHGAIEQRIEDEFDHPVQALVFNSWGADMAPANPAVDTQAGAPQRDGYDRMEAVGAVAGPAAADAARAADVSDDVDLWAEVHRVRIDRSIIGYDVGVFPFEYGGVYCGQGFEADCDPNTDLRDLDPDKGCVAFTEEYPAPNQTVMSAGRIGDLHFVTFPGEPGTLLAEQVLEDIRNTSADIEDVAFFGYSQDYLGYSILEEDWWQGGYEAGGALWGPRQGEYLAAEAARVFEEVFAGAGTPLDLDSALEPAPVEPFAIEGYTPYTPDTAVDAGTVAIEVGASYDPVEVVHFAVLGSDPWLGAPLATLETLGGEPVLRPGGTAWTSDEYAFWLELEADPSYDDEPDATSRRFVWHVYMPAGHTVVGGGPQLDGDYRLRVTVPTDGGEVDVISGGFRVSP